MNGMVNAQESIYELSWPQNADFWQHLALRLLKTL
jgi:hypothetical protein